MTRNHQFYFQSTNGGSASLIIANRQSYIPYNSNIQTYCKFANTLKDIFRISV